MKQRHRCGYPLYARFHDGEMQYYDDKSGSVSWEERVRYCPDCGERITEVSLLSEAEWLEVQWRESAW